MKGKKRARVEVEHFDQIIPEGEAFMHHQGMARGKIAIPDYAQLLWNTTSGPYWTWNQENHYQDEDCIVCKLKKLCTQNVTVWSRSRTVLVVHDYHPALPC